MTSFDRRILPGREGVISIIINTRHYKGKITKRIRVYSNDPESKVTTLTVLANVKVPIDISSQYVNLFAREGDIAAASIMIRPVLQRPLKLTPVQFDLKNKVVYRIDELKRGKLFRVSFRSKPLSPQFFYGKMKIKTNYPEHPEIIIYVRCRIVKRHDNFLRR